MLQELRIHDDFDLRVVIRPKDYHWAPSPQPGVERMMLDRIGGEVARATTIVRYAPNSAFSSHTHGGGKEYFVLEGVLSDEHGEYPAGTYAALKQQLAQDPNMMIKNQEALSFYQYTIDKSAFVEEILDKLGYDVPRLLKPVTKSQRNYIAQNTSEESAILYLNC